MDNNTLYFDKIVPAQERVITLILACKDKEIRLALCDIHKVLCVLAATKVKLLPAPHSRYCWCEQCVREGNQLWDRAVEAAHQHVDFEPYE